MEMELNIINFTVVFLLPLLPSIVVAKYISPKDIGDTKVEGTLLGFGIKAGGGVATYIIFLLLAMKLVGELRPPDNGFSFSLNVAVNGNSKDVKNFLEKNRNRIKLLVDIDGKQETLSVINVDADANTFNTQSVSLSKVLLGKEMTVFAQPAIKGFSISEKYKAEQGTIHVNSFFEAMDKELEIDLHLIQWTYLSSRLDYDLRYFRVITNKGTVDVDVIDFGPDSLGELSKYRISAYRADENDIAYLRNQWAYEKIKDATIEDVKEKLSITMASISEYGDLIRDIEFNESEQSSGLQVKPSKDVKNSEGLRIMFGVTPRIEGLNPPLKPGESIIVEAMIHGKGAQKPVDVDTLRLERGTRPKLHTQSLLLMVSTNGDLKFSDRKLGYIFKHWSGSTDEFGKVAKRKDSNNKFLFVSPIEPLSRVALPLLFTAD